MKNIVYVYSPALPVDYNYYPNRTVTPISYFRLHKKILAIFNEFPQYDFYFKLHLYAGDINGYPLVRYAIEKLKTGNNIKFVKNVFTEYLDIADLIIIDTPSTTFIQALCAVKPVIALFDDTSVICEKNTFKLLNSSRIKYFTNTGEFINAIFAILTSGKIENNISADNIFFERFCCKIKDNVRPVEKIKNYLVI